MKKLIIISLSLIFIATALEARTISSPTTTTTTTTASVTPTPSPAQIQNPGLYTELEKTSNHGKNAVTKILATAAIAGGIAYAVCSTNDYKNCLAWSLTAAAFGGAIATGFNSSKGEADTALQQVSTEHPTTTPPGGGGNDNNTNSNQTYTTQYHRSIERLRERGVTIDPKTGGVTMPNGKSYTQASLSSPAAMQAAGLSPSAMEKIKSDLLKKVEKEVGKGADSTGENGEYLAKSGSTNAENVAAYSQQSAAMGIDRSPAQVQGLSVNYNGEPIGVSRSDLFQSITNRVKAVDSRDGFLTSP